MSNSKTLDSDSSYERDDIYFCLDCGEFHLAKTHQPVNIAYTDMPAEFALEVMYYRQAMYNSRKKSRKTGKGKGFGVA